MFRKPGFAASAAGLLALFCFTASVRAQVESRNPQRPQITQSINEENRVALKGNTRREANPLNDRGQVAEDFAMEHMLLQLKRSPRRSRSFSNSLAIFRMPNLRISTNGLARRNLARDSDLPRKISTRSHAGFIPRIHGQRGLHQRHGHRFLGHRGTSA